MAALGVTLRPTSVSVDPGTEAVSTLMVENLSGVVHRVELAVTGPAASWAVPDPSNVSVLPGQIREVALRFRPPRAPAPLSGKVPFGVTVSARDAPGEDVETHGDVVVNPFVGVTAAIEPSVSHGFRRARHLLRVQNTGNEPVAVEIAADDPALLLALDVRPSTMVLEPGGTGKARIGVSVLPGWPVGEDRSRPFVATVRAGDGPPVTVEAAMLLRVPPTGRARAAVAAAVVAVAAVAVGLLLAGRGGGDGPRPAHPSVDRAAPTVSAAPASSAGATTTGSPPSTAANSTVSTAAPPPGPASAIALGAQCRLTADLRVNGSTLSTVDGTFSRRFRDQGTALAARTLLARHQVFCTIGKAADDDAELTFAPPPLDPAPTVSGGRCSNRYAADRLVKRPGPDNTSVLEVGPGQNLFYSKAADRDRAFALLQGYDRICWIGGGSEDVFSGFFDWATAITYF